MQTRHGDRLDQLVRLAVQSRAVALNTPLCQRFGDKTLADSGRAENEHRFCRFDVLQHRQR